jgi:hypothetical protein
MELAGTGTARRSPERHQRGRTDKEDEFFYVVEGRFVVDPVFVTGRTGYIGRPLITALLERGYGVHALVWGSISLYAGRGKPWWRPPGSRPRS